jgi:hypothetical protein
MSRKQVIRVCLLLFALAYIDWVIQGERRFYLRDIDSEDIVDLFMTYFAVVTLFVIYRYLCLYNKKHLIQKGKTHLIARFTWAGIVVIAWETLIYFLYSTFYYEEPLTETSFFYNGVPMITLALGFLATVFYVSHYAGPANQIEQSNQPLTPADESRYIQELIVNKGDKKIIIAKEDFGYFFTRDKVVWMATHSGGLYIVNQTLMELENSLDPSLFFRINRQLILSRKVIKSFSAEKNQKISVEFTRTENLFEEDAMVSKYNAPQFKQWINGQLVDKIEPIALHPDREKH